MKDPQEIIKLMRSPSTQDINLVSKAFSYAESVHQEQKRFSGEPYFIHVFETAKILADLGMSSTTISAGLLHDCLEDGKAQEIEIEEIFGKEILFLIEGVTKLGKFKYRGAQRHNESLRKLFVAISQDIRVIIIKLADRLHNMRTLEYVLEHKRKRIAAETLEIYVPIAYRLGIRKLNRQLEDLAFPFVHPEEFKKTVYCELEHFGNYSAYGGGQATKILRQNLLDKKIQNLLDKKSSKKYSKENLLRLDKFQRSVRKVLVKKGITNFSVDYRMKTLYSLFRKLERKDWNMNKIYDILALRIIVSDIEQCYKILGITHSVWRPLPGRIKDYIAFPKPNSYQALHTTIFTGYGNVVEIQIKTKEMHQEAEYGIASHINFKENIRKNKKNNFLWIRRLLPFKNTLNEGWNKGEINFDDVPKWIKELVDFQKTTNKEEYIKEEMKSDFFQQRIFVFTPNGDVVDLPIDSSPIDFAYAIHSDIGNHIAGVKVNGKMISLEDCLSNGDIVEILTNKKSKPKRKWLDYVKTATAKKHIKTALY